MVSSLRKDVDTDSIHPRLIRGFLEAFNKTFLQGVYKRRRLRKKATVKNTAPPKQGVINGFEALIVQRPLLHLIFPFFQLSSSEPKLNQAKRVPPRRTQN